MKIIYSENETANLLGEYGLEYEKAQAIAEAITYVEEEDRGEQLEFSSAYDITVQISALCLKSVIDEQDVIDELLEDLGVENIEDISDEDLKSWINDNLDLDDLYPDRIGFFNGYLVCYN